MGLNASFRHLFTCQGLSPPVPQRHLPTYPLSVAAPKQWWASSTPQKRSDLKMEFFSWQSQLGGSHCWVLLLVLLLHLAGKVWFERFWDRENMEKHHVTQKERLFKKQQNLLGNRKKIGRPHRLTLLPAYSQDVGGGKCCDMTWDWDLKGHDMPEPLLGMGQNHSKPFKTHINPKIAGTWIFNLPKILD